MLYDSDFAKGALADCPEEVKVVQIDWSIEINDLGASEQRGVRRAEGSSRMSPAHLLTSGLQHNAPMTAGNDDQ